MNTNIFISSRFWESMFSLIYRSYLNKNIVSRITIHFLEIYDSDYSMCTNCYT